MVNVQGEIPLLGRVETPDADVPLMMDRQQRALDRRLEDWIASNLDLPSESKAPNRWEQIVGNLPGLRRPHEKPGGRTGEGRQVRSSGAGRGSRSRTGAESPWSGWWIRRWCSAPISGSWAAT